MNKYLSKIDSLLDTHVPFKNLNKKELKFLTKLWIIEAMQNSIKKKNNICSKFMKCKNKVMREYHHNNYKNYRNLLSTLFKRAKEKHLANFFNENIKDITKTWKGIKSLVSLKQKNNDTPSLITKDEKYINDSVSDAEIVHSKIKFSNKSFKNFLLGEINNSFLIISTNNEKIYEII